MREPDTDTGGTSGDGIGYCIRPDAAVPPTAPVADMGDGPSAYVCATDTDPLREALAAAFGSDLVPAGRSAAMQAHS